MRSCHLSARYPRDGTWAPGSSWLRCSAAGDSALSPKHPKCSPLPLLPGICFSRLITQQCRCYPCAQSSCPLPEAVLTTLFSVSTACPPYSPPQAPPPSSLGIRSLFLANFKTTAQRGLRETGIIGSRNWGARGGLVRGGPRGGTHRNAPLLLSAGPLAGPDFLLCWGRGCGGLPPSAQDRSARGFRLALPLTSSRCRK